VPTPPPEEFPEPTADDSLELPTEEPEETTDAPEETAEPTDDGAPPPGLGEEVGDPAPEPSAGDDDDDDDVVVGPVVTPAAGEPIPTAAPGQSLADLLAEILGVATPTPAAA